MLRWRNWRLKYEGVQDRALKLYPATKVQVDESTEFSAETTKAHGDESAQRHICEGQI